MRVIFTVEESYPDEIKFFSNIEQISLNTGIFILADYTGSKELTEYIEDKKAEKLILLNESVNAKFQAYLAKYPEVEVQSFTVKSAESAKVAANPDIPLADTPYLSALTSNDIIARNSLAEAVNAKVKENAQLETYAVTTRDAIKACKTQVELDAIII